MPFKRSRRRALSAPAFDADQLIDLLFPSTDFEPSYRAWLRDLAGSAPFTPSATRRVLAAVDQQHQPSLYQVRFGPDDVAFVDVGGCQLAIDRADVGISAAIAAGSYEPHVAAVLDALVRPGAVVVDIGANIGFHTVRAARSVGATGNVVAIEANPENARLLACTLIHNAISNVELLPIALADRRGFADFGSHLGTNAGVLPDDPANLLSGRGTVVPCFPLDELDLARVDLVKIDIEGAEATAMAGARTTIERLRPTIVMEFSCEMTERVSGVSPLEHLTRITDLGYELAVIDRSTFEPVPFPSAAALLESWGDHLRIEDLLLTPRT